MLKVFQIYHDQKSKLELFDEYIPYFNENLTVFFESEVMKRLVQEKQHLDCEWFGVVGNKLKHKIAASAKWRDRIRNNTKNPFTPKTFESYVRQKNKDVVSFTTHHRQSIFRVAEQYHPGITKIAELILKKLNYRVNILGAQSRIVYFNYFVARPQIYEQYVNELLAPAMEIMISSPDIVHLVCQDSRYRGSMTQAQLREKLGFDHYPFHPFITERLFTIFLEKNKAISYESF